MRIGLVGSPHDLHTLRWGQALQEAGAEVFLFGIESPPPELPLSYICVGEAVPSPQWKHFWSRRPALKGALQAQNITLAHPIHLTPFGVWVWLSGFRPYIPFAMGADVLEYGPYAPPITLSWSAQGKPPSLSTYLRTITRRALLPALLRPTLHHALLCVGDNYELCFTNKYFEKEKIYIEVPTGIGLRWPPSEAPAGVERLSAPHWLLAPRGATRFYGADVILKAFQAYCEKGGTTFALILLQGAYPLDPTLSPTIDYLEKQYKNMFLFFIKRLDKKYMSYLWQHAAAFISAPVYDGYSYAVAEGRWHGALPIVNAIPAHREILTHGYNAWFVEPFTPEKLTEALFHIEALLHNSPPFWKERNRAWIARYSDLSTNAQLFLAIAEKALAGKHV
ncbi:MAG: hypothetical protein KatS3mg025_0138 [Bacteroidia bacterium]|nr:MAG: hypothetical protein KatS3mg025_0138 [Bacteroidia bacterium]